MITKLIAHYRGGVATCVVTNRKGKLQYGNHDSGSKAIWKKVISQINRGEKPSYDAPWGDSYPVIVQ